METKFDRLYDYLYSYVETSEDKIRAAQDIAHLARVFVTEKELLNEKSKPSK